MDIKTLWGFVGNAELLGAESPKIKAGKEFRGVDDEYAHALIGKGLAVEVGELLGQQPSASHQAPRILARFGRQLHASAA